MKKKLLVLLAVLLAFMAIFVACDNGGDPDNDDHEGEICTVTFKYNYDGAPEDGTREVVYGDKIGDLPVAARAGFVFDGWYAEDDTEFETPIVPTKRIKEDLVLVAKWSEEPPCQHTAGWKTVGFTEATCEVDGVLIQQCRNPRCTFQKETFLEAKKGHDFKETKYPATCVAAGKIITKCKNDGCEYRTEVVDPEAPATGEHDYTDWMLAVAPTNYAYGSQRKACKTPGCLAGIVEPVDPLKIDEYDKLPIKNVEIGGKKYVNVSGNATAKASSLYRLTSASSVLDGAPATYWRADTLVTTESYVGDQLEVTLADTYELAMLEFVLPNYYGWALGEGCTVKYKVELFVDNAWVDVGTVSDADNADPTSQRVTVALELSQVYTTNKIRLTVTHATRYTPAMVCEVMAYGFVGEDNVIRAPQSIASIATGFITGSYNAWVSSSAANLLDGSLQTSWCTDAPVWWNDTIYGRYRTTITNWAVDYDNDGDDSTLSTNFKKVSKVVVSANKLVGQTIEVLACRQWEELRLVKKQEAVMVPETDADGNPIVDEQGNPVMKEVMQDVKDAEGKVVMIPATDEDGNEIYDIKTQWISLGKVTMDDSTNTTLEFYPTKVNEDKSTSNITLEDVVMVRVEVDNYGADEDRDEPTVTSVVITEDGSDKTYNSLEWTYRRKIYATVDFPTAQFIAYLELVCDGAEGRVMSVQLWEDDPSDLVDGGYWKEFTQCVVGRGQTKPKFTIDIGEMVSKIRVEIIYEPARFGAYVYEIAPYTIAEIAKELVESTDCPHKYTASEPVEVVAPTCTTAGYTVVKCKLCDASWKTDAIDATGHKWDQGKSSIDGLNEVIKYTCKVDGCGSKMSELKNFYVESTRNYISTPKVTKYFHNAPAAWSMTFDDGNYIPTYEWVAPELAERHMTATAVVTVQYASGYINNWKKYVATGAFDLGSHSTFHAGDFASDDLNEALMMSEIDDAFFTLMSWVPGQRVLGFATPNGKTGSGTANFVNDLMLAGRSGGQAGVYCDPDTLTTREAWGNLPCYVAYAYTTFGQSTSSGDGVDYKGAIDYLVSKGLWTTECIHTIHVNADEEFTGTKVDSVDKDGNPIKVWGGPGYAGDKFSTNKFVFEKKLDYFVEKGVWVASYTEAISYFREAHAVRLSNMSVEGNTISFEFTDGLDDIMLVQPLTFEFSLPSDWTDVTVTQNGVEIPVVSNDDYKPNMAEDMACTIKNGVLYFDAIPDGGAVVITKK